MARYLLEYLRIDKSVNEIVSCWKFCSNHILGKFHSHYRPSKEMFK